jgi:hypothetical protein
MRINNHPTKRIGKGAFMTAYRDTIDMNTVYLVCSDDYNFHELYTHINMPHVPYVYTVELYAHGDMHIFGTRYYEGITKHKDSETYQQAKILQKEWKKYTNTHAWDSDYSTNYCAAFVEYLREQNTLPARIIDALDSIVGWASNYTKSAWLEFNSANLAYSEGILILRDCIFCKKELMRKFNKERKARLGF